jgi:CarD family transcriptional regulator
MFKVGDYVSYETDGVCRLEQITMMNSPSKDKQKKLYYVLIPMKDSKAKIYSAVENTTVPRRLIMTEQEARNMVEMMSELPNLEIENEKYREDRYKKALKSCDCREWIRMVKTIYLRKQGRLAAGKKCTTVDEYYLKAAEELLLEELSISMHMSKEETQQYIRSHVPGITDNP